MITARDIYLAIGIVVAFLGIAWLVYLWLKREVKKLAAKTRTALDNMLVEALERPLGILIILLGLYLSSVSLPLGDLLDIWFRRGFYAGFVSVAIYGAVKVVDALLRWYSEEIAKKTKTSLDDRLVPILRIGFPIAASLLGIVAVLEIVGVSLAPVRGWLAGHGIRLGFIIAVSAVALFGLSGGIPAVIAHAVRQQMAGQTEEEVQKRVDTLSLVLVTSLQIVVITIALFTVLSELGIDITPVLAGVGVAGIAIGFGAQSLVKDIIAGLFVVLENQYRVGDVVKIADVNGLVEDINLRRTVLRDLDGAVHIVPNGEIRVASNFTREWSRVNVNISVGYGENLDRVMEVINRVGKELAEDPKWRPSILKPPQAARVDKLGDSGVEIKILGDTKPTRQWDVTGELLKRLKTTFDVEGIEIPWPHTKVYFGNVPAPPGVFQPGSQESATKNQP